MRVRFVPNVKLGALGMPKRKHGPEIGKMIGYLRTSTVDQLLGIDAQRERVGLIARGKACDVVRWFTEHESGGNNDRAELDKALRLARRIQAIVCVALS